MTSGKEGGTPTSREMGPCDYGAQWQPIETAPKDGTHVLVGTFPAQPGQVTIATAHWFDSRAYGAKSGGAGWALSVNFDGDHSDHGVQAPTHWMPLPAPPGSAPLANAGGSMPTPDPIRDALVEIAQQELSPDMSVDQQLDGDFEGAYNSMIERARKALSLSKAGR